MEKWAEIRRLHRAEGMGVKAIVRRLGVDGTRCGRRCVRTSRRVMSGRGRGRPLRNIGTKSHAKPVTAGYLALRAVAGGFLGAGLAAAWRWR